MQFSSRILIPIQVTNIYKTYMLLSLLLLAISPAVFLGDGNRNLALIFFMLISPFFLRFKKIYINDILLYFFIISIVLFPAFVHVGHVRWSTVLYSILFCILFLSYNNLLMNNYLNIESFIKVTKYLILAYTITIIIQQVCVLLGLPIFNVSNYDPKEPWKLNSLSAEPSHSARIVGLLMLAFIESNKIKSKYLSNNKFTIKDFKIVWLCFCWTMLTMLSVTAFIIFLIVILSYFNRVSFRNFIYLFLLLLSTVFILPESLVVRAIDISFSIFTLDYQQILIADHSGGMRIAPMLVLTNFVEIFSTNGMFGNGIDSIGNFLSKYIWGVEDGITGGGFLALWYEYGFISFIIFVIFTIRTTSALKSPVFFIFWFLLVFMAGVNNQIVWLTIIFLHTLNYYNLVDSNSKCNVD